MPYQYWEIVIIGDRDSAARQAFADVICDGHRLFRVVAPGLPDRLQWASTRQMQGITADGIGSITAVPLLQDRGRVDGQAALHVHRDCPRHAPITGPYGLQAQLDYRQSCLVPTMPRAGVGMTQWLMSLPNCQRNDPPS